MAKKKSKPKPAAKRQANRSWGGRFAAATDRDALAFTASIGFDIRLYPYDIRVSTAHARMLAKVGVISAAERNKIVAGLGAVEAELAAGKFVPDKSDEDIHMAVERRLVEKIGRVGAKLHAGKSRNDQVATDVRLFVKDAGQAIDQAIAGLQSALVAVAGKQGEALMPGYTHLQRAQPVLLGHHLLAYHDMLGRDRGRVSDAVARADTLVLGAGALAGTTLPIDPGMVARELGFAQVADNSMDAVASRDFIAELLAAIAILFSNLSRLAGEITLWATSEFGFVRLDDRFSTGSSMMPQKRNPDIAELVRGKSGRAYGNLMALLTTIKGLPLAYNSDLQEDKEPLFDSVDTSVGALDTLAAMVATLSFDENKMAEAASDSLLLATDLAEGLVEQGLPFREAHEITGRLVAHCLDTGLALGEVGAAALKKISSKLDAGMVGGLSSARAVDSRKSAGGTARTVLRRRLRRLSK
ncbi:MAG: argininosuccinate lyase [Deltaproteobacteria bacterium]